MFEFWIDQFVQLIKSDALRIALIALLIVGLSSLESVAPAQHGQTVMGRLRNIGYTAFFFVLGTAGVAGIAMFVHFEPSVISVAGWGVVVALMTGLFLSDLLFYWYHRAQHTFGWLWPLHELHHSDAQLNVTTSMRSYWLEYPIQVLIIALPVQIFVGVSMETLIWSMLLTTSWLYFTHTNLPLRLGLLTPVVCGPQVHRIHHSIESKHQNKNFAQFFPFIDLLFGTYYPPGTDEFPATGTPSLASNASYVTTLVRPFRLWLKIEQRPPSQGRSRL